MKPQFLVEHYLGIWRIHCPCYEKYSTGKMTEGTIPVPPSPNDHDAVLLEGVSYSGGAQSGWGKNPDERPAGQRAFLQSHTMPDTQYTAVTADEGGKSLIIVVAYNNLFGMAKMIWEYFKKTG